MKRLLCLLLGHRPLELQLHKPNRVTSWAQCERCGTELDPPAVHVGRYPRPASPIVVRRGPQR